MGFFFAKREWLVYKGKEGFWKGGREYGYDFISAKKGGFAETR